MPPLGLRGVRCKTANIHATELVFQAGVRVPAGVRPLRMGQHRAGYAFLPMVRRVRIRLSFI